MTKHLTCLLLSLLINHLSSNAQSGSYSEEVMTKIQQVERHLAGDVRTSQNKDWTIQERMKYHHVHGLSMAVIHNYKVEWAKAYGWADSAQHRPVTTETGFQAGSISKSLNGIGLLTLMQDKKVDLYTDINQYLTTWKFPYDSVANGKKINTANLLSHTAGLSIHGFPGYAVGEAIPTLKQILDGHHPANTEAVRSLFEPGLKFKYSGGGITISQLLLMDVTHQPYDSYMWERVLKPMGMTHSSFTQPPSKNAILATGYDPNGKQVVGKYHIYPEQAAAGLWTTPTDLGRYIIETQLAYLGKSSKILNSKTTQLRLTPYMDISAALGVFIVKKGADTYFNHDGSDEGFVSSYYGSLTNGNGVVVMVNSDKGGILTEVVNSVARVYDWKDFYKPIIRQTVDVPAAILDTYVGDYELDPKFMLTFTRKNNQLVAQITGQSKFSLLAETETKFYPETSTAQIEFVKDNSGKVTKLIFSDGPMRAEAKKIK